MLEAEYGSSYPVAMHFSTEMKDAKGNVIDAPICDRCGQGMITLIGREAYQHYCMECESKSQPENLLTKTLLDNLSRAAEGEG